MDWRRLIWPALCLVTLCVFWQTRQFEFLNIDDDAYVTRNPHVAGGLTADNVRWAFSFGSTAQTANWHPLTYLSLMLDAQLWGSKNPAAFHLTNVVLHTLNVLLLYGLLYQWTGAAGRSAFVAALFAVHPLHVESVAWISERKDVLSTMFGFLALLAYGRYARTSRRAWYLATCVAFTCSLLAKQMLVTIPFLVLLLDIWPLARVSFNTDPDGRATWRRLVWEKASLLLLAILFCVIAVQAQREGNALRDPVQYPIAIRLENAVLSCALYLKHTVWPAGLAMYYPHPGDRISHAAVVAAAMLLATLTAVATVQRRKQPWLAVGWFWFVGTLVPVIGLVQIGDQQMADRYTYFPLIGIFLAVAWGVPQFASNRAVQKYILPVAGTTIILVSAAIAWNQTAYWKNDFTLLEHTLAVTTDNVFVRNNLGAALLDKGDVAAAARQFEISVRVLPTSSVAQRNLGIAYFKLGQPEIAIGHLEQAVKLQPDDGRAHLYIGLVAKMAHDWNRAERHLFLAARLLADDAEAHYHLGAVYQARNALAQAEGEFQKTIALQPDVAETYNNLGVVQMGLGKRDAAIASFKAALQRAPHLQNARENLRLALEVPP